MAQEDKDLHVDAGMSKEDKFFGTTHPVLPTEAAAKGEPEPPPEVEVVEDGTETSAAEEEPEKRPVKPKPDNSEWDDEELSKHSERVQKRIKKLTWQAKEAERNTVSMTSERDEAVRAAQNYMQQNSHLGQIITTGEAQLVAKFKSAAEGAIAAAKAEYKEAYESGETDQVIAAQEAMIKANAEMAQATNYEADYLHRNPPQQQQPWQQPWPMQQQPAPVPAPVVRPPDPEAQDWQKDNEWFGTGKKARRDMTAIAFAKHETLIKDEGYTVNSPDYYEEIDAEMRLRFPEYFEEDKGGQPTPSRRRSATSVVAPSTRQSGKTPRKVKLTPSEVSIARRLGLTPQQYANQVLKDRGII